jgi:hypothetical protein
MRPPTAASSEPDYRECRSGPLHPLALVQMPVIFLKHFPELFAVSPDTRNRDYPCANGVEYPNCLIIGHILRGAAALQLELQKASVSSKGQAGSAHAACVSGPARSALSSRVPEFYREAGRRGDPRARILGSLRQTPRVSVMTPRSDARSEAQKPRGPPRLPVSLARSSLRGFRMEAAPDMPLGATERRNVSFLQTGCGWAAKGHRCGHG